MLTTHPFISDDDKFHEECGVFGIHNHADAAAHCVLGLHALQHRGQEAAGIVSCDGDSFYQHLAFGKVGDTFHAANVVQSLKGTAAIGHNRYSTSGQKKNVNNIQPIFAELAFGGIALAHNGNLTNAQILRKQLVKKGSIFRTTMDTEVVMHLIATSGKNTALSALKEALKEIEGGYSMIVLTTEEMVGVRDPLGIRPLILGKLDGAYILVSETCALDIIGAKYIRDIDPGEMVIIRGKKIESERIAPKQKGRFCIFEYVYFSRPDSHVENKHVYTVRKAMGAELARESHVAADVVVPVPDSGIAAGLGYAEAANLPMDLGIIRNHYVGRTFIEPTDTIRHLGVKLKHNANRGVLEGKRVILVDDSVVRGTTSKKIVNMVREAGAKEIHMRISSPPTTNPCFYGVDTPSKDKLLACQMTIKEMAKFIGADSLEFLTVEGMYRAVGEAKRDKTNPQFCDACFTGQYPIKVKDREGVQTELATAAASAHDVNISHYD